MTTFLLIHGAWHGAWCWRDVVAELEQAGHGAIAADLPCDDPDSGWLEYASAADRALAEIDDDLIVVGHSLGGGVAPLLAGRWPVRRLCFVCSYPPKPGLSLDEAIAQAPNLSDPVALAFRHSRDDGGNYIWPNLEAAAYAMYHDCPVAIAEDAYSRLRPQSPKPFGEVWPLAEWPDLPITFIVCRDDRLGRAEALTRTAHERFGVTAVELDGGHSPFLSRPYELAQALLSASL